MLIVSKIWYLMSKDKKKGTDVPSVDEEICEIEYRHICKRVHMLTVFVHYNRVMIFSLI